jgi:hypothetical protein
MIVRKRLAFAVLAISLVFSPASAPAAIVLGGSVIVQNTGNVIAEFLGHTAAFSNDLYLDSPSNSFGIIFNNQTTPVGTTFDLGSFAVGTELIFRIHVNDTGFDYFTGPASRNPDGLEHAVVDDVTMAPETIVRFEDIFGGGDLDYDDLQFSFTNVQTGGAVPEPSSVAVWAVIVAFGIGLARFRKSRG